MRLKKEAIESNINKIHECVLLVSPCWVFVSVEFCLRTSFDTHVGPHSLFEGIYLCYILFASRTCWIDTGTHKGVQKWGVNNQGPKSNYNELNSNSKPGKKKEMIKESPSTDPKSKYYLILSVIIFWEIDQIWILSVIDLLLQILLLNEFPQLRSYKHLLLASSYYSSITVKHSILPKNTNGVRISHRWSRGRTLLLQAQPPTKAISRIFGNRAWRGEDNEFITGRVTHQRIIGEERLHALWEFDIIVMVSWWTGSCIAALIYFLEP